MAKLEDLAVALTPLVWTVPIAGSIAYNGVQDGNYSAVIASGVSVLVVSGLSYVIYRERRLNAGSE